ncbi:MAG: 2,3,4,5-tetrahydropyridine-2,6-dicarboxylate N-succinyltransferase, partial [Chitinophagales bacterium]
MPIHNIFVLMIEIQKKIEEIWSDRSILVENKQFVFDAIDLIDRGKVRVAEKQNGEWTVNDWVKKAILLYFPSRDMETFEAGPMEFHDKIPLKTNYAERGIRVVPHAVARYGSFIQRGVVLMPSYVNIGAYIDEGTMVDTWATVGSCAQIGKHVHLSGGVGI